MDISKFTVEDFVYDPSFRKWVLDPDMESDAMWDGLLLKNPSQRKKVVKAREILLRIASGKDELSQWEHDQVWKNIDSGIKEYRGEKNESKIIPINSPVRIPEEKEATYGEGVQFYRIVAILVVVFGLGILVSTFLSPEPLPIESSPVVVFEEHTTPPGIKSFLTLSDGSNVKLNSGSTIRYVKGFDKDKREIFLEGEAFFDVFKNEQRPFVVKKGDVRVIALGTSFNVKAYEEERLDISLVSGKVGVNFNGKESEYVLLEKGEGLHIEPENGMWEKTFFSEDEVLGWTRKLIVFNKTPVSEAVRILENWYGITFQLQNRPSPGLLLSGRFENETLKNVLEGLSYTTQLEFELEGDTVKIKF